MEKLAALTGVRAYAAYWVVFFHLGLSHLMSKADLGIWRTVVDKGYLGVDLFFVLSGFIISYVYQKQFAEGKGKLGEFYGLRLARMIPVHYFMLIVYVIYFAWFLCTDPSALPQADRYRWSDLPLHVLNIQSWGIMKTLNWNIPDWSISAEWFAYLLFPFMVPWLVKLKSVKSNLLPLLGCLAALHTAHGLLADSSFMWTYDIGLFRVTVEFLAGCFTYNIYRQVQISERTADLGAGFAFMAILAGMMSFGWDKIVLLDFFPLLIFCLAQSRGFFTRLFSNKIAVFLGEISFSIYMVHDFINMSWPRGWEIKTWPWFWTLGLRFAVITIAAYFMYTFIEAPARNKLRALLKKRSASTLVTTPT